MTDSYEDWEGYFEGVDTIDGVQVLRHTNTPEQLMLTTPALRHGRTDIILVSAGGLREIADRIEESNDA